MKRKLFSKKDGTTFVQDVKGISEDVKVFFNALPLNIKKWIAEAEDIVRVLEELQKAVQDGQPADTIIDSILAKTKTDIDDRVYEWLKSSLEDLLFHIDLTLANADDIGTTKFQLASEALIEIADISRLEADTTAQIAVFLQKA